MRLLWHRGHRPHQGHEGHGHGNAADLFSGRHSRVYDLAARRLLRGVYRRLAADAESLAPRGGAVLDVGTGPGVLLVELAQRRPDLTVTGIDLSVDMVASASRNLARFGDRASARVADVTDLPFPDGSFDLVVSSLSLHHWDHPERAVPQLARVLRPGGRLVIYDFRAAPFDELTDTAATAGLFSGQPPQRSQVRTGPLFPRLQRYLTSA